MKIINQLDHTGHLYQTYLLKYDGVYILLNFQPKRKRSFFIQKNEANVSVYKENQFQQNIHVKKYIYIYMY